MWGQLAQQRKKKSVTFTKMICTQITLQQTVYNVRSDSTEKRAAIVVTVAEMSIIRQASEAIKTIKTSEYSKLN